MTTQPKSKRVTRYVIAKSLYEAQYHWSGGMSFTEKPRADKELGRWPKNFPAMKVFKATMTITEAK